MQLLPLALALAGAALARPQDPATDPVAGPVPLLKPRFTLVSDIPGSDLGRAACGLGDVDDDGHGDFALGLPGYRRQASPPLQTGRVRIHSGRTGRLLLDVPAPEGARRFGFALAPAGDRDGDEVAEIQIGL